LATNVRAPIRDIVHDENSPRDGPPWCDCSSCLSAPMAAL
jgi:hypothetical protein